MANSGGTGIMWLVVIAATSMLSAHCQAETKVVCNSQSWLYGDQLMNWHQAYARCRQRSGYYLAAPTNLQDLACIRKFPATSGQHRWIGISDIGLEGYYTFVVNGRRAQPLAWGPGQPNNFEHCVVLQEHDKHYGDVRCSGLFGYICQSATVDGAWGSWQAWSQCSATCGHQGLRSRIRFCSNPSPTNGGQICPGWSQQTQDCRVACPVWSGWTPWSSCKSICGCLQRARTRQCHSNIPGAKCAGLSEQRKRCLAAPCPSQWCPAGWHTGCTKCYKFSPGGLQHYEEAKTACVQQSPGSRLLAVLSEDEVIDVVSFLSKYRRYWVWNDITDEQREGVWVHGQTPTNYTNWWRGEPNGVRYENCVSFHTHLSGSWMDTPCRYSTGLQAVCEKDHSNGFGFSSWGVWSSSCSATCGQGTRSRRRGCTWREGRCSGNVEDIRMCSLPNCPSVPCGTPQKPNHGVSFTTGIVYRSQQFVSCAGGYRLSNSAPLLTRTCDWNGQWIPSALPDCEVITCPVLTPARPLLVQHTGVVYSSTATYSCTPGYLLFPADGGVRKCVADCPVRTRDRFRFNDCSAGRWSGRAPLCSPVPCLPLGSPPNGIMTSKPREQKLFRFGIAKAFTCKPGYNLRSSSSSSRHCQANGIWSGAQAECLPAGVWSAWGNWSQCSASCSCGRKLRQRQCTGETGRPREGVNCSGSSTEGVPCLTKPCKGQLCPAGWIAGCLKCYQVSYFPLHTYRQAQSHCERQTHGSQLLVVASQEDQTDFGAFVLWRHVRTWVDISEFTSSTNDNSSISKFQTWQVEGRNGPLSGCAVIGNAGDGIWTQEPCGAQYQAVCERALATAGGYGEWGEWGRCSVTCGEGVRTRRRQCNRPEPSFEGSNCTAAGQESGPCPVDACPRADCGRPDLMSNGWQVLTGTLAGDSQTLGCRVPFVLTGVPGRHTIRRCTTNGTWTPESLLSCKVLDCGNPSRSPNLLTEYQTLDNTSSTLAEVVHSCPAGFTISSHGDRRRTCEEFCPRRFVSSHFRQLCHGSDTRWSGTPPLCTPRNCERLAAPMNGKMTSNPGQEDLFHVGINKTFSCNDGYRLGSTASRLRACLANMTWSGQSAQCTRELACPRPICELQVGQCSLDQNRPAEACSVEAKINSDLGVVARVKRDTQPSCIDNDDKYIITLRVREELYKNSERCGFLPGITGAGSAGRYDIAMELTFEEGCPCPVPESGVTYLITAKCDPSRGRIVSHPHSLFQRQTTRGRKNLLRRCQWA